MKVIWVVCGPTASGKTSLAIKIAIDRNAEILSADSRQVFSELNIGVAKPEPAELAQVPHHFIGHVSIHEAYSAGKFAREARSFMKNYFTNHNELVICGGTGLYLRALLEGVDRPPPDPAVREEVTQKLEDLGLEGLLDWAKGRGFELNDPDQIKNPRRVQRWLEWALSGQQEIESEPWPSDWRTIILAPYWERAELYQRINNRVETMMEKGLWEEVRQLLPYKNLNALQTVGYQEIFEALEGRSSRADAIEKIKQHTRNYAKRQMTWFKKMENILWVDPNKGPDYAAWLT
jgi:tRNA dimethylallyltransferase